MLSLNLAKIRTPHTEFAQVYAPEELAADNDSFAVAGPVSLAFDIEKDKRRFRLAGRVRTLLVLPCSRCLEGFELDVDARSIDAHIRRLRAKLGAARDHVETVVGIGYRFVVEPRRPPE